MVVHFQKITNTSGVVKQQYKQIVNGYNLFQKIIIILKKRKNAFLGLISSKKEHTKENIKDEDLIQKSLYDDIISLLKTIYSWRIKSI